MTHRTSGNVLRRCDGLPHPEKTSSPCTVVISRDAIAHLAGKHVANSREPWAEWIGPDSVRELANTYGDRPGHAPDPAALDAIVGALEQGLRDGFGRPMVFSYRASRREPDSDTKGKETWIVLCPQGAVLVVRPRSGRLVTAFFPKAACQRRRPDRRWRDVVQRLVLRYATVDSGRGFTLPATDRFFTVKGGDDRAREWRRDVRFITPESWGFCPELEGVPWRGRLADWPSTRPATPTTAPDHRRHRLRPRRPRPNEDSDG